MAINIPGTIAAVIFYIAILVTGIIAGRKTSKNQTNESVIVADRSLGFFVSFFTVTATMVGGAFINGTAESVANGGFLQAQAPIGYCLALLIASYTTVPVMRKAGYLTMIDPFQLKYGRKLGALMVIPLIIGDLFWSAAIFYALGATVSIILDIEPNVSIIISATVACIYTYFGGLYSVAYTDIIQLFFIAVGLIIAFPFALTSPSVDLSQLSDTSSWLGTLLAKTIGYYIDVYLLCLFGGMTWQPYYQRVLACRNVQVARLSSIFGCFFSLALAIPPMAIGFSAKTADWNQTSYQGPLPLPESMHSFILPLALTYLTPLPVAIIGVGAVSAAVMSSADSSVLSTSSVVTKNIYQDIIRPKASERELRWVMRICVILASVVGTLIAILSKSVYGLFISCSDLLYVMLFPQLVAVLWISRSNGYGSLAGYFVSFILRMLSGDPLLGIPAAIRFPLYDENTGIQYFPYRTFAMLAGGTTIVLVSMAAEAIFRRGILPLRFDVFQCAAQKTAAPRPKQLQMNSKRDVETTQELLKENCGRC